MTATPMPPMPPPPPAAAAPADAKPAPKPRGLIRWGVLIFLIVATLAFAFLGAGPIAKWAIQKYGTTETTKIVLDGASLNIFKWDLTLKNLKQVDAKSPETAFFTADEVKAKINPIASLRGQIVIDEVRVTKPRGKLVRGADGTINGQPAGEEPPPGTSPDDPTWKKKAEEMARKRDLIEDVKNLAKKIKEYRDKRAAKKAAEREQQEKFGIPPGGYAGEAAYIRNERPAVVIRHLVADGVEYEIQDEATGAPPQKLTDGKLEVHEFSTSPTTHDKEMTVKLEGKLASNPDSLVKFDGMLDLRGEDTLSTIKTLLQNIPLEQLDPYWRQVLPLQFVGSTLGTLDSALSFKGFEIDLKPSVLLENIQAKAREPGSKIAGFESSKVAQELTNAGKILLESVRISGPIWAPKIEGDVEFVKQLVVQGGKAYATKQASALYEAQKDKLLEKNPELKEKLEKSPAGDLIKDAEKLGGEGGKSVLDKAGGFFGSDKKKEEKK